MHALTLVQYIHRSAEKKQSKTKLFWCMLTQRPLLLANVNKFFLFVFPPSSSSLLFIFDVSLSHSNSWMRRNGKWNYLVQFKDLPQLCCWWNGPYSKIAPVCFQRYKNTNYVCVCSVYTTKQRIMKFVQRQRWCCVLIFGVNSSYFALYCMSVCTSCLHWVTLFMKHQTKFLFLMAC